MINSAVIVVIFVVNLNIGSAFEIQPRIIGGDAARSGQFPYFAHITAFGHNKEWQSMCGAVIISNEWILTAAHCLKNVHRASIRLGTSDLNIRDRKSQIVTVDHGNFHIHKYYNQALALNDVALIRLPKKIKFSRFIKQVHLPVTYDLSKNLKIIAMGHGLTNVDDSRQFINYSPRIKYVELKIISRQKCLRAYPFLQFINSVFCAISDENEPKMIYMGDSGSPAVKASDQTLVGIVSFGPKGNTNAPQGFQSIYSYIEWIINITKLNLDYSRTNTSCLLY